MKLPCFFSDTRSNVKPSCDGLILGLILTRQEGSDYWFVWRMQGECKSFLKSE
jgi:hypothetical protein